ncbi:MAG: hypothetical protein IIB00_06630 [candidate division Zixibacteria bacterium]|nr:hypothetical protein [candidate division Zixibacteria bacterium]
MNDALAIIGNLMFQSKVDAMLSANNLVSNRARTIEDAKTFVKNSNPRIVILDLCQSKVDPLAFIEHLRSNEISDPGPILCYSSHIETELMEKARSLGATRVAANSLMSSRGAELISECLRAASNEPSR